MSTSKKTKKNIHPTLHPVVIEMQNGEIWTIMSTMKSNVKINSCKEKHPAWNPDSLKNMRSSFDDKSKKMDSFFE